MKYVLVALVVAIPMAADDAALPISMWHEPPARIGMEHWIWGPGGRNDAPVAPFTLLKRDTSGYNPKVLVKDARGRTWDIKLGAKVIPDTFCSRFVTAVGYMDEPAYYVPSGVIRGAEKLHMTLVSRDGHFTKGRFQPRGQPDFVFMAKMNWQWADNPFRGTRELAGLKILMMLLSNWDNKDGEANESTNNGVFRVPYQGREQFYYGVFDWGGSLGRWGHVLRRDQSDCSGFTLDTSHFVRRKDGGIEWGYQGKHSEVLKSGVTVEDIRWLLTYLRRITPEQMRTGLKASGATERQSACWAGSIERRIGELEAVAR